MANAGSLVLRSDPLCDERLPAYLLRLSGLNGYRSPAALLRSRATIVDLRRPPSGDSFSKLLGLSCSEVNALAYDDSGKFIATSSGSEVPRAEFRWNRCKICPECVTELRYAPWVWDLRYYRVCERHFCWLRDTCESCEKPLSWFRPDVDVCTCGADLSLQKTPQCSPNEAYLATLMGTASGRMEAGVSGDASPFRSLDLTDLTVAIRETSLIALYANGRTKDRKRKDDAYSPTQYMLAADLISNWPEGFTQLIYQILRINGDISVGKLFNIKFYRHLNHKDDEPLRFLTNEILDIQSKYVRITFDDGEKLGLTSNTLDTHITRPQFSERSGLTAWKLARLEKSGIIQFTSVGRRRRKYLNPVDNVLISTSAAAPDEYKKLADGLLDKKQAARLLGISKRDYGIFDSDVITKLDSGLIHCYSRRAIENLLTKLDALATDVYDAPVSDDLIEPMTIARAISLALEHRLALVRISPQSVGMARYALLDRQGLIRFRVSHQGFVTRKQAVAYLQTTASAVDSLLRANLLPRQRVVGRVRAYGATFPRSDVTAFGETYLLREHLAHMLNCGSRSVVALLRKHGFEPIVGSPELPPSRRIAVWDRKTMKPWLDRQGFQAPAFHW